jgi:hypothetical protein
MNAVANLFFGQLAKIIYKHLFSIYAINLHVNFICHANKTN